MCPIFDGSMLTDFEKYEKITHRTIQFWVPLFKLFYLELLGYTCRLYMSLAVVEAAKKWGQLASSLVFMGGYFSPDIIIATLRPLLLLWQ